MRCAKRIKRPMISLAVGDQSTDADNEVVDVLWELIAYRLTNFRVSLTDETVRGCKAVDVRYGL